jgi:hypothetical protein
MTIPKVLGACAGLALMAAGPTWAAHTGGLASPVGPGRLAISAALAYTQEDVEDGKNDEVSSRRILFRAEYGLTDGLDLHGTIGLSDAEFDDEDFEGTLGPSFGAGIRYGLLSFPESALKLVADLQWDYFRSEDGSKDVNQQAVQLSTYLVKEIGAAGRVGYFYTYGGVRVSYSQYDGDGIEDFTGEDFIGVFGGADYFVNPNVYFFGEAHLFDETGIYFGVGYRF